MFALLPASIRVLILVLLLYTATFQAFASELPPRVPNPIGPNGKYTRSMMFTTRAYQDEALWLILQEANRVAEQLQLPEQLPITETNIVKAFINPFGYAYVKKAVGNVTTKNYVYYVSQGNKFSYLESPHQDELCHKFQADCTLPTSQIDTNAALDLANKWLSAASMDVKALGRDCSVKVELDAAYVHPPVGKFVPVYYVGWSEKSADGKSVASVRLFLPTKALLQLRVEDPKYILRPPLVFTNLAALFPGKATTTTNKPGRTIFIDGSKLPVENSPAPNVEKKGPH
jgi:hypothetical protein